MQEKGTWRQSVQRWACRRKIALKTKARSAECGPQWPCALWNQFSKERRQTLVMPDTTAVWEAHRQSCCCCCSTHLQCMRNRGAQRARCHSAGCPRVGGEEWRGTERDVTHMHSICTGSLQAHRTRFYPKSYVHSEKLTSGYCRERSRETERQRVGGISRDEWYRTAGGGRGWRSQTRRQKWGQWLK